MMISKTNHTAAKMGGPKTDQSPSAALADKP